MIHRTAFARRATLATSLAAIAAALAGCGTAPTSLRAMAQPITLVLQSAVK